MTDLHDLMTDLLVDEPALPFIVDDVIATGTATRRHRRRVATAVVSTGALAIATGVTISVAVASNDTNTQTVKIGHEANATSFDNYGEKFTPLPDDVGNAPMSAADAWSDGTGEAAIPAAATVTYGQLHSEGDDQTRLVWAFTEPTRCGPTTGPGTNEPSLDCTDWVLIDATTGKHIEEIYLPNNGSVYPPISGPTPVKPTLEPSAVVTARATVDDNRTFSPPKDPAAVLSPQQALDAAWQHVGESGITDVRLVLSRTTTSIGGTEHDAWLVIFYGTCVQSEGPGPVVSPTPFTPPGPSCYREPTTEVIDAADGHWMFGFSGGNQADPWKLFVPDGL